MRVLFGVDVIEAPDLGPQAVGDGHSIKGFTEVETQKGVSNLAGGGVDDVHRVAEAALNMVDERKPFGVSQPGGLRRLLQEGAIGHNFEHDLPRIVSKGRGAAQGDDKHILSGGGKRGQTECAERDWR